MATEPGDALFVSKLDENGKKKAKEELNELNDKDRELAVQNLRQWVHEQDWLKTPTDFEFLLRFIRVRKNCLLGARETLEHYWASKTKCDHWFRDVDPANKEIQDFIRTGFFLCPKVYDKHGRRVVIGRSGVIDVNQLKTKAGYDFLYKVSCMVLDWLVCDENVQVHGLVSISDYTGLHADILKLWNPENSKRMLAFCQHSLPMRFKALHLYNEPTFMDAILAIIHPFMRKKLRDRMIPHGRSLVHIYEELGMSVFPDEYLPDDYSGPSAGSIKDITEQMITDMTQPKFRDYMVKLSSGAYGVDVERMKYHDHHTVESAFRKLNVD